MFLNKEELKTVGLTEVVEIITRNDDETVTNIIAETIDLMKSYLVNYDVNTIFNATGNARNKVVLKWIKKIVIYEIYNIRRFEMDEVTKTGYEEAMRWLEGVNSGKLNTDLPIKDENSDGKADTPFMKLGGRTTYQNHF